MKQHSLFDAGPVEPKRARDTDPDTSHMAAATQAESIKTSYDKMRTVFDSLLAYTAEEAAAECHSRYGGNSATHRKRVGELKTAGFIEDCGSHMCKVTGVRATKYRKVIR